MPGCGILHLRAWSAFEVTDENPNRNQICECLEYCQNMQAYLLDLGPDLFNAYEGRHSSGEIRVSERKFYIALWYLLKGPRP
jgi:hypothetical protein